jgi:hypothetical protein
MKNVIYLLTLLGFFISCKKETAYKGATFNKITFTTTDSVFKPAESKNIGVFTIDAQGLLLEKIELELEFETWEDTISNYVSSISLEKTSVGNKIGLTEKMYVGGFCVYTWETINKEHLIDPMDTYRLDIAMHNHTFEYQEITIQVAFYIENLFGDIEIVHGGNINGFPKKIYFEN